MNGDVADRESSCQITRAADILLRKDLGDRLDVILRGFRRRDRSASFGAGFPISPSSSTNSAVARIS